MDQIVAFFNKLLNKIVPRGEAKIDSALSELDKFSQKFQTGIEQVHKTVATEKEKVNKKLAEAKAAVAKHQEEAEAALAKAAQAAKVVENIAKFAGK
jgi:phage shock protein A